ncbi:MAG: type II secretion system F family protein [Candidatus Woesearchaeota archaeon]
MKKENEQRIPFIFISDNLASKFIPKLRGISNSLLDYFPNIKNDLYMTGIDIDADYYIAKAIVNAFFLSSLFSVLLMFLMWSQNNPINEILLRGFSIFLGIVLMFILLHLKYPDLIAKKKATEIEKDLVFALKDISLNLSAGISIYDSFVNVSKSEYGETSKEFDKIVRDINSGTPMTVALEKVALRTKSEYLKKTSWQILNSLKSGSNIKKVLLNLTKELSNEQRTRILNYARELNLWSLLYMLFAVAVPSIGSTMLVILSSFAGFGIDRPTFIFFIIICLIIQYVLIGLVKSRRPVSTI